MLDALRARELRSLVYERLTQVGPWRAAGTLLRAVYRPQMALWFTCDDIGPGLIVSHGFAKIVVAESIGQDCLVSQQVTIGWSDAGGRPVIGDCVRIGAGAMVTVGDETVIGAGAVVVHDHAPVTVAGGVPARALPGAADRFGAHRARD